MCDKNNVSSSKGIKKNYSNDSDDFEDFTVNNVYIKRNNNNLFPSNSIRACIIGKSGCGKTVLLMNFLLKKYAYDEYLDYNNLYIFSKSLYQPIYQVLINGLKNNLTKQQIINCFRNQNFKIDKNISNKNTIQIHCHDDPDEIPDPIDINRDLKTLIIFDDIMLEKQNKVESYYTRGRHANVDCFYISQDYIKIPKNTIRENTNFFILFQQDQTNLNYFYRERCTDIKKEEFHELCNESWKEEYGFVTIDITSKINKGKYRKMLNYFYII
jgi:hypothetical protein